MEKEDQINMIRNLGLTTELNGIFDNLQGDDLVHAWTKLYRAIEQVHDFNRMKCIDNSYT